LKRESAKSPTTTSSQITMTERQRARGEASGPGRARVKTLQGKAQRKLATRKANVELGTVVLDRISTTVDGFVW